jgi:hypothetical protein
MSVVFCPCGRRCASRSGFATHGRHCPVYTAYRAAYCEAIERGDPNPVQAAAEAATQARGEAR